MNTAPDHIDELIASYLSGEASAEQVAFLESWRDQNDDNRTYFDQMALIFNKTALLTDHHFDTDRAWEQVRADIHRKRKGKIVRLDSGGWSLLRIAAGFVVLIVTGIFTYQYFNARNAEAIELVATTEVVSDTLPDGTEVFLNRATVIRYTAGSRGRIASLEGEAYFDIRKDAETGQDEFLVEAGETLIRDIGTAFNVKAYPGASTVEVVVEDGEVIFYTRSDPGVRVKAGGKGMFDKNTQTFTVTEPEVNVTAYKTRIFNFVNDSLLTVVSKLNEVYAEKIDISEHLGACRITVTFKDEEPEEIAAIIAETLGLSAIRSGDTIRLEGPGCGNPLP